MSRRSLKLAAESYKMMVESDKLGVACIVERTYLLAGTKPELHSLLFSGLQQLIDTERKTRKERKICFSVRSEEIFSQREIILNEISAISLTPYQSNVYYPENGLEHIRGTRETYEMSFKSFLPTVQYSLPLPQIDSEWGVAQLILRIGLEKLLFIIELLLLEISVLIIGKSPIEVTVCSFSLLGLLKPYRWTSVFMPTLTEEVIRFISEPVPFIAGMIGRDKVHIKKILMNGRVQQEMSTGLTVINLVCNKVHWTKEVEIRNEVTKHCKSTRKCWFDQDQLKHYQERLELLAKNKSSSLRSFRKFFQQGLLPQESVVLHSINRSVQQFLANYSGEICKSKEGFKIFTRDELTSEKYFSAAKYTRSTLHFLEFKKKFSKTQILAYFYDEHQHDKTLLYNDADDIMNMILEKEAVGIFIADWVYFHWILFKKRKS